ncbi:MAG: aerial mycelium formation protein [Actinomycetota bacterium]|nr:aerial mycelium formation protein [Actinomycetota bacterium]
MDAPPTEPRRARRRIDRILDPAYLDDLAGRSTDELRRMRDECEEEESGVSFARRVLQGRIDIIRAEALRRQHVDGDDDDAARSILDALPSILADDVAATPLRPRVSRFLVPPAVQYHRRDVERLVNERSLAGLAEHSPDELAELAQTLGEKESELSKLRRQLLDRLDALQEELARRYRDGRADINEVLPGRG